RSKKQKVEDDKESEELKKCLEIIPDDEDDVTIDATPLSSNKMLKNINREDLKVLWRLVKARFKKNRQGLVRVKNWKLYDSCGVHCVTIQNILYYLLVEKMYPLTNHTLRQMFNLVKLQVDYECEMAYELFRLVKKQLKEGYGRIVGIKSLHEVTAVKVRVTAAKSNLVLFTSGYFQRHFFCVSVGSKKERKKEGNSSSLMMMASMDDGDDVNDKLSLELRFWFCMSNTSYTKYGYGVLKI
nr:hypothetical protein [Tanacetum cinerariifolium]